MILLVSPQNQTLKDTDTTKTGGGWGVKVPCLIVPNPQTSPSTLGTQMQPHEWSSGQLKNCSSRCPKLPPSSQTSSSAYTNSDYSKSGDILFPKWKNLCCRQWNLVNFSNTVSGFECTIPFSILLTLALRIYYGNQYITN